MDQKLKQLQAKIETDKGFAEKLFSLENPQDVQSLLQEQGLEFSIEEIESFKKALVKVLEKGENTELSDDDLEDVAGGIAPAIVVAAIAAAPLLVTAISGGVDQAVRSRW